MMTQEEYMEVKALRAAGWTITQIAGQVGHHPATVSGWLRSGGPPAKRATPVADLVIDEVWQARVAGLLAQNAQLQASSIMRVIAAEGFDGSYQSVTRHLRNVRGPTRGSAATAKLTMPIVTGPGEESSSTGPTATPGLGGGAGTMSCIVLGRCCVGVGSSGGGSRTRLTSPTP